MLELVDVKDEGSTTPLCRRLPSECQLMELAHEEAPQEGGVFSADHSLRELCEKDLALIHHRGKVKSRVPLPDDVADDPASQECVEPCKERSDGACPDDRILPLPEEAHLLVRNMRQERPSERVVDQKPAEIDERPAGRAFEDGDDRISEDGRHRVAPGGRETLEDPDQV